MLRLATAVALAALLTVPAPASESSRIAAGDEAAAPQGSGGPGASGASELLEEMSRLQERLRHLERTGELGGSATIVEEPPTNLLLPAWHVNLTKGQRKLLMRSIAPAEFDAEAAPTPEQCLQALIAAIRESDAYDEIVPFLDRSHRRRYLLTEGHPNFRKYAKADADWISPLDSVFGQVVRVDATIANPDRDDRCQVLAWTQKGASYGLYRIEYRGEGKFWRVAGFKLEQTATYLPAPPTVPVSVETRDDDSETSQVEDGELTLDAPPADFD